MDFFHPIVGQLLNGLNYVRTQLLDVLGPTGPTVVLVGQIVATGAILLSIFAGKTLWAPPTPGLKDFGPRLVAGVVGFCVIAMMIWLKVDPTAPALRISAQLLFTGVIAAFIYLFAFSTRTFKCEFDSVLRVKGLWLRHEARLRLQNKLTGNPAYDNITPPQNTALFYCRSKKDPEFVWTMASQAAGQLVSLFVYMAFLGSFVIALAGVAMAFQHQDVSETTTTVELNLPADVLFEFGKSVVRPEASDALRLTAVRLRDSKITKATVQGHTDSIGTDAQNSKLSADRAEAVKQWLTENGGLAKVAFTIEAHGASKPVAPNKNPDGSDDPTGRALNRRVTIVIDR